MEQSLNFLLKSPIANCLYIGEFNEENSLGGNMVNNRPNRND